MLKLKYPTTTLLEKYQYISGLPAKKYLILEVPMQYQKNTIITGFFAIMAENLCRLIEEAGEFVDISEHAVLLHTEKTGALEVNVLH